MNGRPRLLYAVTAPMSALIFLRGQLGYMSDRGFDVHVLCGADPSGELARQCAQEGATLHELTVARKPSPVEDLRAAVRTRQIIAGIKPDIVLAGTPKMSLLSLAAAKRLSIPTRIYLCHGLRFESTDGLPAHILRRVEKLLCSLATQVVAVSPSVKNGLAALGVDPDRIAILGHGSPNGVDTELFNPPTPAGRSVARAALSVRPDVDSLVTFVGRLTRDKGLETLVALADALKDAAPNTRLAVVGPDEAAGKGDQDLIEVLRAHPSVLMLGHRQDMRTVYDGSDVLVLPTAREGLPTVVIEAGANGVPTVAYAATGTVDAIVDGRTGVIVAQGDRESFAVATLALLSDPDRRRSLGEHARDHVVQHFTNRSMWQRWHSYLAGPTTKHPGDDSRE